MRVTHLGPACLVLQTDTARVLTDPGTFSQCGQVRDLDEELSRFREPTVVRPGDHVTASG